MTIQCIINTCFSAPLYISSQIAKYILKKLSKLIFHQKTCGRKTNSYEHSKNDAKTPAIERTRNFSCFHTRRGDLIELWRGWRSETFGYRKWMLTVVSGMCTKALWKIGISELFVCTNPRIDGWNCAMKLENKLKRVGDWQKVKSSLVSFALLKINFCSIFSSSWHFVQLYSLAHHQQLYCL